MNKIFYRRSFVVLIALLFLAVPFLQTNAMTLSPVRIELSGNPGESTVGFFKVINEEQEAKTLYTVFENFEAMGESGSPSFKPSKDGLASWLEAPEVIDVGPGESKMVDFKINTPKDAEPGGYFSAIFLATTPPSAESSQLTIGSRIGVLILFRVNGEVREGASLLEFKTKDAKTWHDALPISFYYRFQNTGADRVMPKGTVTIKNMFGKSTKVIDANAGQGNILPGSIRRFELWWQKDGDAITVLNPRPDKQSFFAAAKYQRDNFAFGRYIAELDLSYGTKGENAKGSFTFFVFPWQFLTIEIVGLLLVILILGPVIRFYNRWVVKRAAGNNKKTKRSRRS